jgi:hypothetical protein
MSRASQAGTPAIVWWRRVFRRQLVRQLGPHVQDQLAHGRAHVFHALEPEELLVKLAPAHSGLGNEQQEQPQPLPNADGAKAT